MMLTFRCLVVAVPLAAVMLGDWAVGAPVDAVEASELAQDDECRAEGCGVNLAQLRARGHGVDLPRGADLGGYRASKASRAFAWGEPMRSVWEALEAPGWQDSHFSEGLGDGKIDRAGLSNWIENDLFAGAGPFGASGHSVPVPWPESEGDQVGSGHWVAYTRRQVCYITAKALVGAGSRAYWNGLTRFMAGCPRRGDFGQAMVTLLASCAVDPGLADGAQGPLLIVARGAPPPVVADVRAAAVDAPMAAAGLRLCQYDDGAAQVEGVDAVPASGCTAPNSSAPGRDFMTGGLAHQAVQDISASFLGGYVFGNACGLGGGQDERLMVYFPEVAVLTFFLSQDTRFPQLRQPAWVLGSRMFFSGLDGSARFNRPLVVDEAVPLTSDLTEVNISNSTVQVSGSRPFIAFMSENQGYFGAESYNKLQEARRNKHPEQRLAGDEEYSFEKQVRAWYGAVTLTSYATEMRPVLKELVGSIGTGPWLAGLWWGDSQVGMLASWIGQALAAPSWGGVFPLDYYLYADFTENPGNQCFVHSASNCRACLDACKSRPLPDSAYWMPNYAMVAGQACAAQSSSDCGQYGIEDVFKAYNESTAHDLWSDAEAAMRRGSTDKTVFDLLLR